MGKAEEYFRRIVDKNLLLKPGYEFASHSINDINDLLSEIELENKRESWTSYSFHGINVPRVTHIIGDTINKEYLTRWAAKLGNEYNKQLGEILDTGSFTHELIEEFLMYGKTKDKHEGFERANYTQAMKAFQNFKSFYNDLTKRGYKLQPVSTETSFSTPWYGGTIDLLAYIISPTGERKLFILDFKTSKKISFTYFVQLAFYAKAYEFLRNNRFNVTTGVEDSPLLNIINNIDPGPIQGIGIIRVDKERDKYEYILADHLIDIDFIAMLYDTADSMLNWYYYMNAMEEYYKDFRNHYIERGGIDGLYR